MSSVVMLDRYIAGLGASPLAPWRAREPWELTSRSVEIVREMLGALPRHDFEWRDEDVAIHRTAVVDAAAALKGPLIVGAECFVAAGTLLRGGSWIAERCSIGLGSELKSSFLFPETRLAHFNFVGDSILGADVNLEAGSIVCNHRNERSPSAVRVRVNGVLRPTGCDKFGALVGDRSRIGANAVLAPGTLLAPASVVERATLCDQER